MSFHQTQYIITVTKQDYVGAVRANPFQCIIARAIRRSLPMLDTVMVGTNLAKIGYGQHTFNFKLPSNIANLITNFDNTGFCVDNLPITFTMTKDDDP